MGIPPSFLLSCFVSDLTLEIRFEVQAHQPLSLTQAADLARLQKEKFFDHRPSPPPPCPRPPSLTNHGPLHPNPQLTLLPPSPRPSPSIPSSSPRPNPPPPFKHLTFEEIVSRRKRGLCFSCDEKYHKGHRCASRVFLLLAEEDKPPDPLLIANLDPSLDPS